MVRWRVELRTVLLQVSVHRHQPPQLVEPELREDMNRRFDDVNRRLAVLDEKGDRHFTWMVSTQVALLLAVVSALVGAYYR